MTRYELLIGEGKIKEEPSKKWSTKGPVTWPVTEEEFERFLKMDKEELVKKYIYGIDYSKPKGFV